MHLNKLAAILFFCAPLLIWASTGLAQQLPSGTISSPPLTIGDSASIGPDTTLNVFPGGSVGRRFVVGERNTSTSNTTSNTILNVAGGTVGDSLFAGPGSTVFVSDGRVGWGFDSEKAKVFISGGVVEGDLGANLDGSEVVVTGGRINGRLRVGRGAVLSISGGSIGAGLSARLDTSVSIRGGNIGASFFADPSSTVEIVGGEFLVNARTPCEENQCTAFFSDAVVSGTLADGTPFVFGPAGGDIVPDVVLLTNSSLPPASTTPLLIDSPASQAPSGLRRGQTLTLSGDGVLGDHFAAVGSVLNIDGGQVGAGLEVAESVVRISGGTIGDNFAAHQGSSVEITGGTIGRNFVSDANLTIRGGTVGDRITAEANSRVSIAGGLFDGDFVARVGSTVNIHGGVFGRLMDINQATLNITGGVLADKFSVRLGGEINLVGSEFFINGELVSITPGQERWVDTIPGAEPLERLTGTLADGSPIDLDFTTSDNSQLDRIDRNTRLTLTILPTPGDFNGDGAVDSEDYQEWQASLGERVIPYNGADGNGDGTVDLADYAVWRENLGTNTNATIATPEPGAAILLATCFLGAGMWHGRSGHPDRRG